MYTFMPKYAKSRRNMRGGEKRRRSFDSPVSSRTEQPSLIPLGSCILTNSAAIEKCLSFLTMVIKKSNSYNSSHVKIKKIEKVIINKQGCICTGCICNCSVEDWDFYCTSVISAALRTTPEQLWPSGAPEPSRVLIGSGIKSNKKYSHLKKTFQWAPW